MYNFDSIILTSNFIALKFNGFLNAILLRLNPKVVNNSDLYQIGVSTNSLGILV